MNIYQSNNPLPYVYKCIHKITREFYFGFRCKNVKSNTPSSNDLGIQYFTSSKIVKPKFEEFEYIILAEFFNSDDAYKFEQYLIFQNWGNPLLLNKFHQYNSLKMFKTNGTISDETRNKISVANKGKKRENISLEHRRKLSIANTGKKASEETKQKLSASHLGKKQSEETILKRSIANTGKKRSPETCIKLSIANTGKHWTPEQREKLVGKKRSDEARAKMSNSKKNLSPESRARMSAAAKNREPLSDETRALLSHIAKNRPPFSDERKKNMAVAAKTRIYKIVECPHCKLSGRGSNMTRYHFDNCKFISNPTDDKY